MLRLTDQQLTFFNTFGFLQFPGLLKDRIDEIIEDFEQVWTDHGGGHDGKPHEGKERSCIVSFIDQHERLCTLLDDPRIEGIAASILGDDFIYTGSDGNYYVGDTRWHSDGHHPIYASIKIAFYLDTLTRDTGALRVIPGSHKAGDAFTSALQEQLSASETASETTLGVHGSDVPAIALEVQPGDVAVFYHATKHSAWGGDKRRRMFTINCFQHFRDEHLNDLRDDIAANARFWVDRVYGEKMVATAGPQRMRHLDQVMANDGHLAELSAKARQEKEEPSRG